MHIKTFSSETLWIEATTTFITSCLNTATNTHIALSGGSTPIPIYTSLGEGTHPFDNLHLYLVDERYTSLESTDSNYRSIFDTFVSRVKGLSSRFHFFDTSIPIKEAITQYTKILPEQFDLTIVGIGPDGHTASLFPHSSALSDMSTSVTHTTTDIFSIHDRLTLTFPPILNSKKLLILLRGENKKTVIEHLTDNTISSDAFPAKYLLNHPDLTIYYCSC
jgi:6-phosphogluconolactonase